MRPGLLCSRSLDSAHGILDDRGCSDVCVVYLGGSIAVRVSLPERLRGSECKGGALIVEVIGAGVALGVDVV